MNIDGHDVGMYYLPMFSDGHSPDVGHLYFLSLFQFALECRETVLSILLLL